MTPTPEQDLRYPIGPYRPVAGRLPPEQRRALLEEIANAPRELRRAVAGLDDSQLETPYRPGGWTVRQLVHHVADSHMNSYIRCKLAITEDEPTIKPYDEKTWAELPDSRLDVETSLSLLDALHRRWVTLLSTLTPEQWARRYRHPERGVTDLDQTLALYAWHGKHHIAHIVRLRERNRW